MFYLLIPIAASDLAQISYQYNEPGAFPQTTYSREITAMHYEDNNPEKDAIARADAEENISTGEEKPEESQMTASKPALSAKQILDLLRRWGLPGLLLIFFLQGLNINITTPFGEITVQTQHSVMQMISERLGAKKPGF
jgi:hypothetical protein